MLMIDFFFTFSKFQADWSAWPSQVCFEAKPCRSKRFTNVVKTIANSTTYCRKQGDCNGTIIFEVDIMKNSSPLNLKFTIFAMSKPK